MFDSYYFNTSLLADRITSKSEHVLSQDLRVLTFQIVLDAWSVSMNVGLKYPIAGKISSQSCIV